MFDELVSDNGQTVLDKFASVFPEAQAEVVSELLSKTEPLVTYLAQVHEMTLAEAKETFEAFFAPADAGFAAIPAI